MPSTPPDIDSLIRRLGGAEPAAPKPSRLRHPITGDPLTAEEEKALRAMTPEQRKQWLENELAMAQQIDAVASRASASRSNPKAMNPYYER